MRAAAGSGSGALTRSLAPLQGGRSLVGRCLDSEAAVPSLSSARRRRLLRAFFRTGQHGPAEGLLRHHHRWKTGWKSDDGGEEHLPSFLPFLRGVCGPGGRRLSASSSTILIRWRPLLSQDCFSAAFVARGAVLILDDKLYFIFVLEFGL